jgi:hypothetical protein
MNLSTTEPLFFPDDRFEKKRTSHATAHRQRLHGWALLLATHHVIDNAPSD